MKKYAQHPFFSPEEITAPELEEAQEIIAEAGHLAMSNYVLARVLAQCKNSLLLKQSQYQDS